MRKRTVEIARVHGFELNIKGELQKPGNPMNTIAENAYGSGFIVTFDKLVTMTTIHTPDIRTAIGLFNPILPPA